ncbi:MAG: hypothetical protein J6C62_00490, partial [Clostridia bacterium]|nr:hypothetical protein [Clostridia bacterium]
CENSLSNISKFGVCTEMDNKVLVSQSEFVLFAIKPQNLNDVLLGIKDCVCEKFISIMAGVKKERLKIYLTTLRWQDVCQTRRVQ